MDQHDRSIHGIRGREKHATSGAEGFCHTFSSWGVVFTFGTTRAGEPLVREDVWEGNNKFSDRLKRSVVLIFVGTQNATSMYRRAH